jgi:BirA family biotin operon repressor/biotin-[acetyl-CoA-carboxylase] ligase
MTTFGSPRRHFRNTDSTNARARELAEAGAANGTIVTADEQSAGRGRQGRSWFAPPGSALLYSAILRPADPGDRPLLPLSVPLALADAVEALAPVRCEVKWPNDVWIDGRKVGGVLIEGKPGSWAIVGVGLNVAVDEFPEELRDTATSVGHDATVEAALAALNEGLLDWIDADPDRVRDAFAKRDALCGREISWDGGSGVAAGIDDVGHLLVALSGGGTVALGAGEVHLRLG